MRVLVSTPTEYTIEQTAEERIRDSLYYTTSNRLANSRRWKIKSKIELKPLTYGYFDNWRRCQNILEVFKWST